MSHHVDDNADIAFGSDHGTVKSYIIGFAISIILTIVPFTLVVNHMLSDTARFAAVVALAVAQLLVQVVFFLHLNMSSKAKWNLMIFVFTVLVVLILVFGSIWIMVTLNHLMMVM